MRIRATITPSELQEAARMSRSKYFWLRFFVANWYATALCLLLIGVAINALVSGGHPQWGAMGLLFVICSFFIWFSWYRYNRSLPKSASGMSERAGTLLLGPDGIKMELASGASTFIPWSSYTKWQEGKSVFVITGKEGATVIPIEDGSNHTIRNLLLSKIGPL